MTANDVRAALRDCFDPGLKLNVEALGLIESVTVTPDHDAPGTGIAGVPQKHIIALRLYMPTEDETAIGMLCELIRNRLHGMQETGSVEITTLPGWTPSHLTEEARAQLAAQLRPQQLVQIKM